MRASGVDDPAPEEAEPLEEPELIERARRGDTGAYDELVRRHQQAAFRTAWLLLGSAADAEDATQDGFVKAFYALDRFRQDAPFRPWLLRIVANEARNRRVASGRRDALALRLVEQPAPTPAVPYDPARAVEAAEERAALLDAINALRHEDRLVIACRYFLELSEAESAAVMGCARGTVKSRLARALARLRDRLGATSHAASPAGSIEGGAGG